MEDVNENYLESVMTNMKILVDEMPMDKSDCPYSEIYLKVFKRDGCEEQ